MNTQIGAPAQQSPWLDTPSAARYLGFANNTLRVWRHEGRGPRYHKVGRHVRYHRDSLDAFVTDETNRRPPS